MRLDTPPAEDTPPTEEYTSIPLAAVSPMLSSPEMLDNHHTTFVIDYLLPVYPSSRDKSLLDVLDNQSHPRPLHDAIFEDDSG